MSSTISM